MSTVSLSVTMKKVSAAQGGFCCVYFVCGFLSVCYILHSMLNLGQSSTLRL